MAKEKSVTFVQARSKLSKIVDRVADYGDTYVVSKRQKPRAVIIGIEPIPGTLGHLEVFKKCRRKENLQARGYRKGCWRYR